MNNTPEAHLFPELPVTCRQNSFTSLLYCFYTTFSMEKTTHMQQRQIKETIHQRLKNHFIIQAAKSSTTSTMSGWRLYNKSHDDTGLSFHSLTWQIVKVLISKRAEISRTIHAFFKGSWIRQCSRFSYQWLIWSLIQSKTRKHSGTIPKISHNTTQIKFQETALSKVLTIATGFGPITDSSVIPFCLKFVL